MRIIKKMRKQKCVYWEPTGFKDDGEPEFGDPVELDCRWEDRSIVINLSEGQQYVSRSIVYTENRLVERGKLKLGKVEDLDDMAPENNEGVGEIRQVNSIPTLKADEFLNTAIL